MHDLYTFQLSTMLGVLDGVQGISLYRDTLLVIQRKNMNTNQLIKMGFDNDDIMCQDCKDAVASHRGRHYDTELCGDCHSERYD